MAALLGIDVDRTISITFIIGAALAAVAGVMFVIYYGVVNFADGFVPGVKAFTAAVLGGIGSLPGAVLGGLLIGLDRGVLVVLFHHRLQGRRGVHDPRDHADLHAVRHPRPARSGEGLSMTAAPQSTPVAEVKETTASSIVPALRNAFAAALVAFGLCFPIISYHAESNINNELILIGRWPLSFAHLRDRVPVRPVPPDFAAGLAHLVRPGRGRGRRAAWAARSRNRRPKRRRGSRRRRPPAPPSPVVRTVRARFRRSCFRSSCWGCSDRQAR